ncbi:MAG TPA: hypothetical protein VL983_02745 [Terriglobales bacterium]|nr:hypothetical protein [Terriglobales bacterium]
MNHPPALIIRAKLSHADPHGPSAKVSADRSLYAHFHSMTPCIHLH